MNSLIQQFTNSIFGEVRSILINREPWFVGADVARCLGYSNTRDALIKHVDNEDKSTVAIHDGSQNRNMIIINESGLYSLILRSNMPIAKEFKHWVTSEVLPTMRKIGFDNALQMLQQENIRLQQRNGELEMSLGLKNNEIGYIYHYIIHNPNISLDDKIASFRYDPDPEGIIGIDVNEDVYKFMNAYGIRR